MRFEISTLITIDQIKQLRELTGVGVMDAKRILEEAGGSIEEAKKIVKREGLVKAEKKSSRKTDQGLIISYIHAGGRIGVLVEVNCETDFVARTFEFKNLCQEVAMQIAALEPQTVEELLKQEYIRDVSKTVEELIKTIIVKTGENIQVARFVRFKVGE